MKIPLPTGPFTELIENFVSGLRSSSSRRAYRSDLIQFAMWLTDDDSPICKSIDHLDSVEYTHIESYLEKLSKMGRRFSTMARALTAIREWFRYLGMHGYVKANPAANLKGPKIPKRLPVVPSAAEMDQVCDSTHPNDAAWPSRDRAIFQLLYDTGVQVSEISALDLDNIDRATNSVFVRNQNGIVRQLPLSDSVLNALDTYLHERAARLGANGAVEDATMAVFVSAQLRGLNDPKHKCRLVPRSILRIVKRLAPELNCRAIRLAFGVHQLNHGADVRTIAAHLGIKAAAADRLRKMAKSNLRKRLSQLGLRTAHDRIASKR